MTPDPLYMRRAIELAQNAEGFTSPNPLVGAVLVAHGRIIGEGYHHCAGMPHAEVIAINSVRDRALLRESTLYVSLEPCSHYGKTPPCAELILREGIPHVVVAMLDPFPSVSGRGIKMLRDAGVSVQVGLLAEEAEELNRHFLTAQRQHRPYVTLKWAESSDGFIDALRDDASTPPVRLSTPLTTRFVHHRRMIHDAILVGFRTALLDNPSLTVRHWYGRNPLRVVTDRHLALPRHLTLFDGSVPTLVFTEKEQPSGYPSSVSFVRIDPSRPPVEQMLAELHTRGIQSLLVEGGACILRSFIDSGLYDDVRIERSTIILNEGVRAPHLPSY
ncbi:riboflavin biosynthesis protein RibD [Porphyromonas gingivalis]|uniref:bifunctional diaminohydroxyphosphoribosylaminopyrimidine deaminase/5-amino-6-(5-phosphoribosylamino)uracil reductase RibD n=1 Tax=Porphyromonas gingivalis TaxID=837 RepID=UPI000BE70039|nr:bifunctional diaminohydroxyphosphoribosylaminopyrimidine deaminase/5-amino-6-(5-phosphoribosylamino)uracil reductase RibD [Porphyromonas gingivalis]MCE8181872.1 bifunctional diaminohydroxyphosphoribosylaminopyrimidine deaminase/5-amino-6-(5-phosphoribosylamino)uracil reductase RibD [Porphyromonas gingivalis]PDP58397.1 riboflavin biosynthesis protein RibD [Porphyromonas gingivalis]